MLCESRANAIGMIQLSTGGYGDELRPGLKPMGCKVLLKRGILYGVLRHSGDARETRDFTGEI